MKTLSIDLETFSDRDLNSCGVYRYAESPFFCILLFAYSVDGGEVQVIDLMAGQEIPEDVLAALTDSSITKYAYNAIFERVCLSEYLRHNKRQFFKGYGDDATRKYISPRGWKCTMTWAAYMGLPLSLRNVGLALKLDEKKMDEGKDLIRYFCMPCKPTASNGGRTRNLPSHAPDKWKVFKAYNKRDVEVEMSVQHKLRNFPVPEFVWEEYWLDQEINDRGIMLDMQLVNNAISFDEQTREALMERMKQITEIENPNSVQQMKAWLKENGLEMESLGKKEVAAVLKTAPPELAEALTIRQMLSKSSVRKYRAMQNAVCQDGRARGMFQFYGANRSGRFSGRIIQLQNLPQNHMSDLEEARELVKINNFKAMTLLYDNIPSTLSELIRTAFIPKPGYKFIVSDFSAIEARVLSWLAKEQWRMDTFANGGDIYCATASKMFHCNVVKHGENGHLRQKGKSAELACGYGGSIGAMKAMGALESGMQEDELKPLVDAWREANPNIVKLWYAVDSAAKKAVQNKTTTETHGIKFICQSGMLFIELPSGRRLSYVKPMIGENQFGGQSVTYMGQGIAKKWERIETFAGKLVENCIAEGTLIVTNRGLIPIEKVTDTDLLWDGLDWVAHEGLIRKGIQPTVAVGSIHMTADHKILTTEGWVKAIEAEGFNWKNISLPDSFERRREKQKRGLSLALPLCMRNRKSFCRQRYFKKYASDKILRLHDEKNNLRKKQDSWNEQAPCMGSVAFNEATLPRSQSSCLQKLWGSWNYCLREMAFELREFLGGYGLYLAERHGSRQDRQQQRLLQRELSLDNKKNKLSKQKKLSLCKFPFWKNNCIRAFGKNRYRCYDSSIQAESRVAGGITVCETGLKEYVYDIRNCGSRHRFAVWDNGQARIVSNCTQAIARDILCFAMNTLRNYRIVAHVHDEIIIECPQDTSLEFICKQMSITPPWAEGLVLNADGYECQFYKKD